MKDEPIFTDDDFRTLSAMYWDEEDELKAGVHPTQIRERIEQALQEDNVEYEAITYLHWIPNSTHVRVKLDGEEYGVFDYQTNNFVQ